MKIIQIDKDIFEITENSCNSYLVTKEELKDLIIDIQSLDPYFIEFFPKIKESFLNKETVLKLAEKVCDIAPISFKEFKEEIKSLSDKESIELFKQFFDGDYFKII